MNVKLNTYTGCEYWAVDLDNAEGGKFYNVAVVISNPSETEPAAITITNMAKAKDLKLENNEIPPLGQDVVLLPKGLDVEGCSSSNAYCGFCSRGFGRVF